MGFQCSVDCVASLKFILSVGECLAFLALNQLKETFGLRKSQNVLEKNNVYSQFYLK